MRVNKTNQYVTWSHSRALPGHSVVTGVKTVCAGGMTRNSQVLWRVGHERNSRLGQCQDNGGDLNVCYQVAKFHEILMFVCLQKAPNNARVPTSHETLEIKFHAFSMTKLAIFHDHFRGLFSRNFSREIHFWKSSYLWLYFEWKLG